jgi:mitochondrial fission protein ELM1
VQYGPAGAQRGSADLHLREGHADRASATAPLLGAPHRLTAMTLQAAHATWHERLDHLPHPRLALLVGSGPFGAEMQPSEAFRLANGLAGALHAVEGAILAVTDRRTGREATDALAAGLAGCMHLLYRQGEPGPDPELGFLSVADAVVVAGNTPERLLRACALTLPVYVSPAGPLSWAQRRLHQRLLDEGHIRMLDGKIEAWKRSPLDEAGRAAGMVLEMLATAASLAPTGPTR